MKRSVTNHFFIVYLIVAQLMGIVLVVLVGMNQADLILDSAIANSTEWGLVLREQVMETLGNGGSVEAISLEDLHQQFNDVDLASVFFTDEFGVRITAEDESGMPPQSEQEIQEIHAAVTRREFKGQLFHFRIDRTDRILRLYLPLQYEESTNVMIADIRLTKLRRNMKQLTLQTVITLILVLGFVLTLTYYTWHRIVVPITRMTLAVDRIQRGLYDLELDYIRQDEIGHLAQSISRMGTAVRGLEESSITTNPLTGLPGNSRVHYWIEDLLERGLIFCSIFTALENLEAFNKRYGYSRGDEVILFAAQVIRNIVLEYQDEVTFVGHQGGGRFVAVCSQSKWETICKRIIKNLDEDIGSYYDDEDRLKGCIESPEGSSDPLISISLSVISNRHHSFSSFAEITGEAKDVEKGIGDNRGSRYSTNQRTG